MDTIADVAQPRSTHQRIPLRALHVPLLPTCTPGTVLAHALASYPAPQLFEELRGLLSRDAAARVFDAAVAAAARRA